MKLLLITFSLITFSLNAQEAPMYQQVNDNVPEIGVKNEVYLGDRMLIQREGEYRECIIPKETHLIPVFAGGAELYLKGSNPLCKKDADSELYSSNYIILDQIGRFRLTKKGDKYDLALCVPKMNSNCKFYSKITVKDIDESNLELHSRYFIYTENKFQQSIEYAGRDGDNLRFNYSEFTDGFARQAFTREFQIDYAKGDVAAYKGAIIKIHDATNINIVYEVIRNFQQ